MRKHRELLHDASLHLVGGLVGKRYGKYSAMTLPVRCKSVISLFVAGTEQ
jgi:hypothetical protein